MLFENMLELIGNTPIVRLTRMAGEYKVFAKLEMMNPGSSVKDRIALNMVREAEKKGTLKPGGTIIEPTSGNTGIGLAIVAAVKGYKLILVMPESMSSERKKILKTYGAELILTPKSQGMTGAINRANEMVKENKNFFMPSQFDNPANPEAHRQTTAREIAADMDRVDALVIGVGTGGTITGTTEVLKKKWPEMKTYAVEPEESAVISGEKPDSHMIQGIGAGFIPEVLNCDLLDDIITVNSKEAYETMKLLAEKEGILAGISSGANVKAALEVARKFGPDCNILTVLPDTGERYLSLHGAFKLL